MIKINLLNYSPAELEEFFLNLREKPFCATQLIKWIYQLGNPDFSSMTNFSLTLRKYLTDNCEILVPEMMEERISQDGTIKWLLRLGDDNLIETVLIPDDSRETLCISSQVGCVIGCTFCATGALGFRRNLELSEIIGQLWFAMKMLSLRGGGKNNTITNVVFMGMGEPLLNYENIVRATQLILNDHAYGLSKYKVTMSTCGIIPNMLRLRNESEVALAVSLHATNDELRNKLVPINLKYPIRELISVCNGYFRDKKRAVTIEYIMLAGINDSLGEAKQLVNLLSRGHYKVNLIPANFINNLSFCPSDQDRIDGFRQVLLNAGIGTITRKPRGADIGASCGQLAAGGGV